MEDKTLDLQLDSSTESISTYLIRLLKKYYERNP